MYMEIKPLVFLLSIFYWFFYLIHLCNRVSGGVGAGDRGHSRVDFASQSKC